MKRIFILAIILNTVFILNAQEPKDYGIKFSGFVKNDFFTDSRQTVSAREGHFNLWPKALVYDENGNDINGNSSFNFLSIQSRLQGSISGPDAFGAKTSGLIEVDFFSQANDNINLLRMRHAFVKLNWEKLELLTGQYWNPLFVTNCFPATVSFNPGAPFQSFGRNPQIRLSYNAGKLNFVLAALSQRDYASPGPLGTSSQYLRNSNRPDMHFQIHVAASKAFETGAGVAYKSIVPRLTSDVGGKTFSVNESVSGITAMIYAKLNTELFTLKLQGRYGENIADLLAISGYAVKDITNTTTGEQSYTPFQSLSYWADIQSKGKVQFGVFAGYTQNLGTKESMSSNSNAIYGLATDISSLLKVSPRVILNSGKFRVAMEVEYMSALYGSSFDVNYVPAKTTEANNLRVLGAVYYFF